MSTVQMIGAVLAGIILGVFIGIWVRKRIVESQIDSIKDYSKKIVNEAHKKAKNIKKEAMLHAKDTLYRMKLDFEKETKEKKEQLQAMERRLFHKEENLDKKIEQFEQKDKVLSKREKDIEKIEGNLTKKQAEY